MPSLLSTLSNATVAAVKTFRQTFAHPETIGIHGVTSGTAIYDAMFAYYSNQAFESDEWRTYISRFKLYRKTRLIYNPVKRLVDFYAAQLYPGVLSPDGLSQGDQFPLAIPLNPDIDERLRLAIAQFWRWTNFQSQKSRIGRTGAMTGNVLLTIVDEPDRSRIQSDIVWPGFVKDLQLDSSGNVTRYVIEYTAIQEDGQRFRYRKEVDRDRIKTFKNGVPFAFGSAPANYRNPYGFVPAVWIKHVDTGSDIGAPAIKGDIGKVDELNSLVSHIHDEMHKQIDTPQIIATSTAIVPALKRQEAVGAGIAEEEIRLLLKAGADTTVHTLTGNLNLDHAFVYVERLLDEIEKDNPELIFWSQLRNMSQVTGPGAQRMMGDVQGLLWDAAANYDHQFMKLFQMAVAIGGWRESQGDWDDNSQTEKFQGFDLDSYRDGDLDFFILPRVLVPTSTDEQIAQRQAKATFAVTLRDFLPAEQILRETGFPEEDIKNLLAEKQKEAAQKQKEALDLAQAQGAARFSSNPKGKTPSEDSKAAN